MAAAAKANVPEAFHIPVLLRPLIEAVAPVRGLWIDGTFGAGGHSEALLNAGADRVIGIDRDPSAISAGAAMAARWQGRLTLVEAAFADMQAHVGEPVDGVVLDLGVSSMQIDQPERGFSFMRDGPLDMRMSAQGRGAADLVNNAGEAELADILYHLGEERAARRIARAIVAKRAEVPIVTTGQLAEIIQKCVGPARAGQSHPATRSFQAIRIAVNDEFGQLVAGLEAAERVLKPGGYLAVVSFHSLEDRIVKRFMNERSDTGGGGSRYAPERAHREPGFDRVGRAIAPDARELADNPRARSAKLRIARRTSAAPSPVDRARLGLPPQPRRQG